MRLGFLMLLGCRGVHVHHHDRVAPSEVDDRVVEGDFHCQDACLALHESPPDFVRAVVLHPPVHTSQLRRNVGASCDHDGLFVWAALLPAHAQILERRPSGQGRRNCGICAWRVCGAASLRELLCEERLRLAHQQDQGGPPSELLDDGPASLVFRPLREGPVVRHQPAAVPWVLPVLLPHVVLARLVLVSRVLHRDPSSLDQLRTVEAAVLPLHPLRLHARNCGRWQKCVVPRPNRVHRLSPDRARVHAVVDVVLRHGRRGSRRGRRRNCGRRGVPWSWSTPLRRRCRNCGHGVLCRNCGHGVLESTVLESTGHCDPKVPGRGGPRTA